MFLHDHYWTNIMNQTLCFWRIKVQGVPNGFPFYANAHLQNSLLNLSILYAWVQNGCFTPLSWTLILGLKWLTQQKGLTPLDGATLIYFIYYQLLGKWPAGSKVNPFLGAMSPKRPSRFDVFTCRTQLVQVHVDIASFCLLIYGPSSDAPYCRVWVQWDEKDALRAWEATFVLYVYNDLNI